MSTGHSTICSQETEKGIQHKSGQSISEWQMDEKSEQIISKKEWQQIKSRLECSFVKKESDPLQSLCSLEGFLQQLAKSDMLEEEEFDKIVEQTPKSILSIFENKKMIMTEQSKKIKKNKVLIKKFQNMIYYMKNKKKRMEKEKEKEESAPVNPLLFYLSIHPQMM